MAAKTTRTLAEVREWFKTDILPKRTASAGFSGNRLWKSPMALVRGNTDDPDGLCGDASSYVIEAFWDAFGDYSTSDGFCIGLVLWEGVLSNHIANVMLVGKKVGPEVYRWNKATKTASTDKPGTDSYGSAELLRLEVFDLYYKKTTNLKDWWTSLDGSMGGTVKVGQLHSIED